jgi:hypothetical protein
MPHHRQYLKRCTPLMKTLLLLGALVQISLTGYGQQSNLRLDYFMIGLGSNHHRSFPKVTVKGQTLIYTNNYRKRIHYRTKLKAGASDSIEQIINLITDTAVKRFNPCIHSGAVCRLDVAGKAKTVHFTLKNTFDSSAYKIITILNNNLPSKYKLGIPVNWWQNEQPCYEELLREANSLNVKQGGVQQ